MPAQRPPRPLVAEPGEDGVTPLDRMFAESLAHEPVAAAKCPNCGMSPLPAFRRRTWRSVIAGHAIMLSLVAAIVPLGLGAMVLIERYRPAVESRSALVGDAAQGDRMSCYFDGPDTGIVFDGVRFPQSEAGTKTTMRGTMLANGDIDGQVFDSRGGYPAQPRAISSSAVDALRRLAQACKEVVHAASEVAGPDNPGAAP